MSETEAARLLADMRARYMTEPYDPTQDVTLADIAAALDVTPDIAREYARREVKAGRMTVRLVNVGKHRANVYRRPTP